MKRLPRPISLGATSLLCLFLILIACTEQKQSTDDLFSQAKVLHEKAILAKAGEKETLLAQVEELLRKAVETDPDSLKPELALANILWERGNHVESIRRVETLSKEFPSEPNLWELKGELHSRLSQWQLAEQAFQKAIDLGGNEKMLLIELGAALGKQSEYDRAFEAFDRSLEMGGPLDILYFNFGLCYEGTGNHEMALENYHKALEENEAYIPALRRLMTFFRERSYEGTSNLDKALGYAEKAYKITNSDIKVLADLADILVMKRDYEAAQKIVDEALILFPEEPKLLKYKSQLEMFKEEDLKARQKED